mgnify:FL=1
MNQILDTGDEQFKNNNKNYGSYNQKTRQKVYKEKSVIEINKIVIFFAISILILGICIIAGSVYAKDKINKNVEENATPVVNFSFNEEESTVDISVHHVKGISQISYILNNQDEKVINANSQQDITTTINLEGGKNKIVVNAIDVNNHIVEYEREYTVGNLAEISLENIDNAVKMTIKSEEKIKLITYSWDEGQEENINVDSTEYTGKITAPKGKHTLNIVVLDEKNVKTEKTQVVIGATAPQITIQATKKLDNKIYYIVTVKDETILKNVKIILDNEEKVNVTVNSNEYVTEVEMKSNSDNKLSVEASNENLTSTLKRSWRID